MPHKIFTNLQKCFLFETSSVPVAFSFFTIKNIFVIQKKMYICIEQTNIKS